MKPCVSTSDILLTTRNCELKDGKGCKESVITREARPNSQAGAHRLRQPENLQRQNAHAGPTAHLELASSARTGRTPKGSDRLPNRISAPGPTLVSW